MLVQWQIFDSKFVTLPTNESQMLKKSVKCSVNDPESPHQAVEEQSLTLQFAFFFVFVFHKP